jgi:hypothetical protein
MSLFETFLVKPFAFVRIYRLSFAVFLIFSIFVLYSMLSTYFDHTNFQWDYDSTLYYYLFENMVLGQIPFRDFFVEYPPFAVYLITFPATVFNWFGQNIVFSMKTFNLIWLLFCWFSLALVFLQSHFFAVTEEEKFNLSWVWAITLIPLCFVSQVFFGRFDFLPSLISLSGILFYFKYIDSSKVKYLILALVLITIATFTKVFPLLFIILIVGFEFLQKRNKNILYTLAVFGIGVLINFWFYSIGTENFLSFIKYQTASRDLEINSVFAGIVMLLDFIKVIPPEEVLFQNSASELGGVVAKIIAKTSLPLIVIGVCSYLWRFYNSTKNNFVLYDKHRIKELFSLSSIILVLIFLIFNKVFSPQYISWVFLLFPLLIYVDWKKYENSKIWLIILSFLVCFCTFFVFPYKWFQFNHKEIEIVLISNLKNLGLIIILLIILRIQKRSTSITKPNTQNSL